MVKVQLILFLMGTSAPAFYSNDDFGMVSKEIVINLILKFKTEAKFFKMVYFESRVISNLLHFIKFVFSLIYAGLMNDVAVYVPILISEVNSPPSTPNKYSGIQSFFISRAFCSGGRLQLF